MHARVVAAIALCALPSVSSAQAPPEALASPARRSPVVQVVETASPWVVNISTEQRVDNPFHESNLDRFFSQLIEKNAPWPGSLETDDVKNSLGSGVVIDPRGYILTNEHVLWRASRILVLLSDRRTFEATIFGIDPRSDLAVLKIESEAPLPAADLGTSSDLMIGETVIAIGNPYGLSNTVTTGVLSATRRSMKVGDRVYSDFVQTDAPISPGSSGGALLSIEGKLIGINTAILAEGSGISFAIPIDRARKVFDDLLRYREVRVAWLGLDVRNLTDEAFAALDDPEATIEGGGAIAVPAPGVSVRRVYAGSPADAAGIAAGDLVTRLGTQTINSRTDFETIVSNLKPNDKVQLSFRRAGADREADLKATDFPIELSEEYLADQIGLELGDIPASLREKYPSIRPCRATA
jgi:serine protease Do